MTPRSHRSSGNMFKRVTDCIHEMQPCCFSRIYDFVQPSVVLHGFYVSGEQNIHTKATKNPPQEECNKSSKKKPPKISCLTRKLEIDVQIEIQGYPKIFLNPAPDHPGTPRWPRHIQKVAQKLKRCILDLKTSQMLQNDHPRPHK